MKKINRSNFLSNVFIVKFCIISTKEIKITILFKDKEILIILINLCQRNINNLYQEDPMIIRTKCGET